MCFHTQCEGPGGLAAPAMLSPTPFISRSPPSLSHPFPPYRMPLAHWATRLLLPFLVAAQASAAMRTHCLNSGWSIAGAGRSVTADLPAYALEALAADGQVPDPLHG